MIYAISLSKIPADFKKLFFPAICTLIELLKKAAKVCGQLEHRSPTLSPCFPPTFLPPGWHIATSCEMAKIAKNNMTAGDASWQVKREREIASWLSKKGHCAQWTHCSHPLATPLPPSGKRLRSCVVCIDTTCQFHLAGGGVVAAALRQAAKNEAEAVRAESEERWEGEGRKCVERGLSQSCHINWQNN